MQASVEQTEVHERRTLRVPHMAAVAGSLGFLAASTVAGLAIARWLGPAGRGEVSYAFLLISMASTAAYFGIDYCATHLLAPEDGRTRGSVRMLLSSSLLTGTVAAALVTAVSQLLRAPVAPLAVAAGVLGFTVARVTTAGTFAIGRGGTASATRAGVGLAYLLATVALLALHEDPAPVVWAWAGCGLLHAAALSIALVRGASATNDGRERAEFFRLLSLGRASWQSSLAQVVTYRFDQVLILLVLGAPALGEYSLAAFVMSILWTVADSIGEIEHPRVAVLDDRLRVARMRQVAKKVVLIVAGLAVAIAASSPLLVPLVVGPGYEAVPVLIAILVPGTVALAAGKVAGATLLAAGRTRALRNATLLTAGVVAIGTYPAVYYGGLRGAAGFSSAAYTVLGLRLWSLAIEDMSERRAGARDV